MVAVDALIMQMLQYHAIGIHSADSLSVTSRNLSFIKPL